jgi:hypothetical protein
VCEPVLQAFPFPSTLGEVTLHPLSQACVFIYTSCKKWVFPPVLWSFPPTATFTSFPAPDCWVVLLLLPAGVIVYSSRGKWVFPHLLWSFPPSATPTSFPAPGCWVCTPAPTRASLARPGLFIYSSGKDSLPSSSALSEPHLLSHMSLLFLLLITQFLFFFSLDGGRSVQGAMLFWPRVVCGSTVYLLAHLVHVFPAIWARATGGPGALLVSPFNLKWRFSAPAGGVEGSKFCLFSVVLPARCVSSVSPRFHYRRYAFCFLPLGTIF